MNDNIKAIREALVMRNHLYCEDPWYSCPKVEDGCANPSVGADCDCGADEHNAKVTLALAALDRIEAQGTDALQRDEEELVEVGVGEWQEPCPRCEGRNEQCGVCDDQRTMDEALGHAVVTAMRGATIADGMSVLRTFLRDRIAEDRISQRASSVCPVCGSDSPHFHTQDELRAYIEALSKRIGLAAAQKPRVPMAMLKTLAFEYRSRDAIKTILHQYGGEVSDD